MVKAVRGNMKIEPDPAFEKEMAAFLRKTHSLDALLGIYNSFSMGMGQFNMMMRRIIWRATAKSVGDGVSIGVGVGFKHIETFQIGDGVFIGDFAYIQGRYDGRCIIKRGSWIGPHSYLDARNLVVGEYVGWGPGAKTLGSAHTGEPIGYPVIKTNLVIKPIRIGDGADIGVNAVILPGVTIGKGCMVGAGAVVNKNTPAYSVVAGVPAKLIRNREKSAPVGKSK